jgi:hypothetical protein
MTPTVVTRSGRYDETGGHRTWPVRSAYRCRSRARPGADLWVRARGNHSRTLPTAAHGRRVGPTRSATIWPDFVAMVVASALLRQGANRSRISSSLTGEMIDAGRVRGSYRQWRWRRTPRHPDPGTARSHRCTQRGCSCSRSAWAGPLVGLPRRARRPVAASTTRADRIRSRWPTASDATRNECRWTSEPEPIETGSRAARVG